ncbi:class I SAM-dependent DNA methyltransferase [Streptomyces sp. NPDC058291]|uniref:class I SAM-dependent DNA methyltransferase n=1 Tax=Streptomyces sp. NPDC058291 TaxID=3346427 RepID=UPI0036F03148
MTAGPPDAGTPLTTRRSYDAVAERYAREIGGELDGKPLDRALLDAFAELAAGGPVADVGCGPGQVTARLAGFGAHPLGVDLSPAMCAVGRRGTGLPFLAADMTALPIRSGALGGIVSLYAVIHLGRAERAAAYAEFARVLRPGAPALVAFHTSDPELREGQAARLTQWWGHAVDLTFRYLDPAEETTALARAGLALVARLDREPHPEVEHPSRRTYLLVRRPA